MKVSSDLPRIGMLAEQFSAYHLDRCRAVARRMQGRAQIVAVEIATKSETYAWEASGEIAGAVKVTLFPGQSYDKVSAARRWWAEFKALRKCRIVLFGIGYNRAEVLPLALILRLMGKTVVMHSASKFNDFPRVLFREAIKSLLLQVFSCAIVGGRSQLDYARFLGFRRRMVLPGYDCVDIERIRKQGGFPESRSATEWRQREFIFVGRFVTKKNLETLLDAYADYARAAGDNAHKLQLIGSGPCEAALRERVTELGLDHLVSFPGFLEAAEVSRRLVHGLALVLVSTEEQWGLVVNEALAVGLPVIVSTSAGSCSALVRNLVNGYLVEPRSKASIAAAMQSIAADRTRWDGMSSASLDRAWMGDTERLADAVEYLFDPSASDAAERIEQFNQAMAETT